MDAPPPHRPQCAEYFGPSRDYWWNQDFLQLMAVRLGFSTLGTVLDVGCGVGHWGRALAGSLPKSARLTGVDREEQWVREATERARRAGLGERFVYQQGDANSLPFADSSFDLVTCQTVLMHLTDPVQGLREMLRVVRPGGLILAVEPSNLASHAFYDSYRVDLPLQELLDSYRFVLLCQQGKKTLGLGFSSLGDLVPGMLAALGAEDIRVFQNDRARPFLPPYATPDQRSEIEQMRDWVRRDFYIWDKDETRRYFAAGGGDVAEFEALYRLMCRHQADTLAAIDAGTYHSAGGCMTYLVAGRKSSG